MSEQMVAVVMPREALDHIVGGLQPGEREVAMLIALTENLVTLTASIVGPKLGPLMEQMIRQLGETAVAGTAEHFKVTQEQFEKLPAIALQVLAVSEQAASSAADQEDSHVDTKH